jgi:peptidoglycan/xylan/chitin deacetylase (PgdA/CDA1 family)
MMQHRSLSIRLPWQRSTAKEFLASVLYYFDVYKHLPNTDVIILMYHRVMPLEKLKGSFIQPGMYVTDEVFEGHLRYLVEHYQVIPMLELLDRIDNQDWDKGKKYCVITFDDGWVDNYEYAYPLLKRYALPATIFLVSGYINTERWFWPERIIYLYEQLIKGMARVDDIKVLYNFFRKHGLPLQPSEVYHESDGTNLIEGAIGSLKLKTYEEISNIISDLEKILGVTMPSQRLIMNWQEINEMEKYQITFGAHSCTHRILTTLNDNQLTHEIAESFAMIDKHRSHGFIPVFAYPNGNYNQNIAAMIRENGFRAAVTTRAGYISQKENDVFALNRIGLHNDVSHTAQMMALHIHRRSLQLSNIVHAFAR